MHGHPARAEQLVHVGARAGCLPSELQKHNASLMRQLASHAYLQVA